MIERFSNCGGDTQKKEWLDIFEIMRSGETGYLYPKLEHILKRRNLILDNLARLLGY